MAPEPEVQLAPEPGIEAPTESASRVAANLAIMVTRRCNMACTHCSVESHPRIQGSAPEEAVLREYVHQAAAAGVRSVLFTGGEPMIRAETVLSLMRECKRLGMGSAMTTNGFWGRSLSTARGRMAELIEAGIKILSVSYDRYHAAFQGPEPALNIARAAAEHEFTININFTRTADDPDLESIVAPFQSLPFVRQRFYDVQPVGGARGFDPGSLRGVVEGSCLACDFPAITDDGRVTACNGPSYFAPVGSPLAIGSLESASLSELLQRHADDPVLSEIRVRGPAGLRDELEKMPGFETFPFRDRYSGMCDLCHHITSDPHAVAALRTRLDESGRAAERRAIEKVTAGRVRQGMFSPPYVNGPAAWRAFLHIGMNGGDRWQREAETTLGRADLDWSRQAQTLIGNGLATALIPALMKDALHRWTPSFFVERMTSAAHAGAAREQAQRELLRRLDRVLAAEGANGVLLGGAAMLAMRLERDRSEPTSAFGGIDLRVEPALAPRLRTALLRAGFRGGDGRSQGLEYRGIPLRLHARIADGWWDLPEAGMLVRARPTIHPRLQRLDAEALVLLAFLRSSGRLFWHGLATAWDVVWLTRRFPDLDWSRVNCWANGSRAPRGYTVPARVLARELELAIPPRAIEAPADGRQRELERIARSRFFDASGTAEPNPLSRNGMLILLADAWPARGRRIASLALQSSRAVLSGDRATALRGVPDVVREATDHWRRYRGATPR